jgi:methylmalonyl-CoA mutase C-terminal domain/subunit
MNERKPRVLITKCGIDGHERGARIIAQVLANAGMEVIFIGYHPRGIASKAIVSTAIQEDVDLIGLSILVPIYMEFASEVLRLLKEKGREDIRVVLGGVIPREDHPTLLEMGVRGIYTQDIPLNETVEGVRGVLRNSKNLKI